MVVVAAHEVGIISSDERITRNNQEWWTLRKLAWILLTLAVGPLSACRTASKPESTASGLRVVGGNPSTYLGLFCEVYEACRQQFMDSAKLAGAQVPGFKEWQVPLPANDEGLTIDFAFFPAGGAAREKLLVLTSGIHGLEGFTGSALQTFFLKTMLADTLKSGVSVLFVHGINAYGFKHGSRYTQHRVDLNRNWFLSDAFPVGNDDHLYDQFNAMLNPTGPAAFSDVDFSWFAAKELLPKLKSALNGQLTQAAGQGQYRFRTGLEFGGQAYEPHRQIFLSQVQPYLLNYKHVMHLDLHTGLGERTMQLLPNAPFRPEVKSLRQKVFIAAGGQIQDTGSSNFYSSYGDFSDFVCGVVYAHAAGHDCVNMLIEYGTLMQTYWQEWPLGLGVLKADIAQAFTLYLSIRENQMYYNGARTEAEGMALKNSVRSLFYPEDRDWRVMVLSDTMTQWPKFIANFAGLP